MKSLNASQWTIVVSRSCNEIVIFYVSCEIKCRIAMARTAFNKRTLFISTLDLGLRKKLVKCYIWSIALHGAETWTLRAVD